MWILAMGTMRFLKTAIALIAAVILFQCGRGSQQLTDHQRIEAVILSYLQSGDNGEYFKQYLLLHPRARFNTLYQKFASERAGNRAIYGAVKGTAIMGIGEVRPWSGGGVQSDAEVVRYYESGSVQSILFKFVRPNTKEDFYITEVEMYPNKYALRNPDWMPSPEVQSHSARLMEEISSIFSADAEGQSQYAPEYFEKVFKIVRSRNLDLLNPILAKMSKKEGQYWNMAVERTPQLVERTMSWDAIGFESRGAVYPCGSNQKFIEYYYMHPKSQQAELGITALLVGDEDRVIIAINVVLGDPFRDYIIGLKSDPVLQCSDPK